MASISCAHHFGAHREGSKVKDLHASSIIPLSTLLSCPFSPAHFAAVITSHLHSHSHQLIHSHPCLHSYIPIHLHIHTHTCIGTCTTPSPHSSHSAPWPNLVFICQSLENPMHQFLIQPTPHRSASTSHNLNGSLHMPISWMITRRWSSTPHSL